VSAVYPNGHTSEEPDYCSVCGAPIAAAGGGEGRAADPPAAPAAAVPAAGVCSSCGAARSDPHARFWEVCRYDFQSGTPGPAPGPAEWDVTIAVDPTLERHELTDGDIVTLGRWTRITIRHRG
jgi:hypothetical protein